MQTDNGIRTYNKSVQKMRDFYAMKPDVPIYLEEFGYYSLERWQLEGHIQEGADLQRLFEFDAKAKIGMLDLGWTESAFCPVFDTKVLEDRGEHELVQDHAGRGVLFLKGKRSGFMPEYIDHPVKDMKTWEEDVKWRLDPTTGERYTHFDQLIQDAKDGVAQGSVICQQVIGGYMYLRSLIGPLDLLYKFYDDPELIHACMETWLTLTDTVIAKKQQHIALDELFLAEDICYNASSLISPELMREFLFPYYQQLIANTKKRQLEPSRKLYLQIDTDGDCRCVIPVYKELGMDFMSPFEVASNCDVVAIRKQYPDLLMRGGFDKRILARGKEAIDREVDRIMPFMKKHGGYIPTCDHGVPAEVSFEDYVHFRKRLQEFG